MKRLSIFIACLAIGLFVAPDVSSQGKVYRSVTNEGLEKILQGLQLKYEKAERKEKEGNSIAFFEFKRGEHTYRLINYGNDLWIECTSDKAMKAEDVNRWNAEAKFSRLVLMKQKDKTTLSLESQLDCLGGVTDVMIRQYLIRFDDEMRKFVKFAK